MCRSKIIWQHCAGVYKWATDKNKLPPVQMENLKWRAQSRIIREEMISCISYYEQCWLYLEKTFSISTAASSQIHTSRQFVANVCSLMGWLFVLLREGQCLILQQSELAWRPNKGETVNEAGCKAMVWQTASSLPLGGLRIWLWKRGKILVQREGGMVSSVQGGARLYKAP